MRGSIWTIVGVGVSLALLPAALDVNVSGDAIGQTVVDLTSTISPIMGLMFFVTVLAVMLSMITSDGF